MKKQQKEWNDIEEFRNGLRNNIFKVAKSGKIYENGLLTYGYKLCSNNRISIVTRSGEREHFERTYELHKFLEGEKLNWLSFESKMTIILI